MDNSFSSIISSANSLLVLLPKSPKLDEVAAGLALYLSLQDSKPISVSASDEMMVEFNRLIGINKITHELGSKNLTVRFINYRPEGIEKVSYDIENGEFKLTIVPKAGVEAPKGDQINVSYAGVSADTVLLIGGKSVNDFSALKEADMAEAKLVHIGIEALAVDSSQPISLAAPASSVSERVASLIQQSDSRLDGDIATNLLAGIEEGSSNFEGPGVTADTFALFADLMRLGGKRSKDEKLDRGNFPPGSIPGEIPQAKAPKSWLQEPKIYKGTSVS